MSAEIASNRRALRNYHIIEKLEAGISLKGTEVKSLRAGLANIQGAYARVENGEIILFGMDVQPYEKASHEQHSPKRPRRLLLHRREITRLIGLTSTKGYTLVPLRLYWKKALVKLELGVGKGKVAADKREDLKRRTEDMEAQRAMRGFNRSRR